MAELPELLRNRLLRRVDWRFLLPDPVPNRVVCYSGGRLKQAVETISETICEPDSAEETCDLAVAADPGRRTLQAAWLALRAGGSCYTEWRWPLIGGAAGVQRRLEAAGFEDVRCFWAWPSRQRCEAWLPLGSSTAFEYFFGVHRAGRSLPRRMLQSAQQSLARLKYHSGLQVPICAVARKTEGPNPSGQRSVESGFLEHHPGAAEESWLLLTQGPRSESKVVALSFRASERQPRAVVKMSRVRESVSGLANEAATLEALERSRPGGIPGVPKVLFCRQHRSLLAVAETPCVGTPIWSELRPGRYAELAMKASEWLVELANASQTTIPVSSWDRLIEPALAKFELGFGPVLDPAMVRDTRDILGTVGSLPVVCEQRDFSPWNVFITPSGRLAVLDWESSELQGLPLIDLIYFLSYLSFFRHGAMRSGRYREVYRAELNNATKTGRVHQECLEYYADRIGVDPAVFGALRLFTWILHSHSEYQHLTADAGQTPAPPALRRSLFLDLWEEQLHYLAGQSRSVRSFGMPGAQRAHSSPHK